MERELKIVVSVFLVYFIYGLTSFTQSGAFITPFFLSPLLFVSLALAFLVMNTKMPKAYILILHLIALTCFALVDEFVISIINRYIGEEVAATFKSDHFALVAFLIFFSYLLFCIAFFYRLTGNKLMTVVLFSTLCAVISLFFTDLFFWQELGFQLFCLLFYVVGQRGFDLKNKTLRVVSYQMLLISLLESFEYFH